MKIESLCRPDSKHWCVECCQGRRCTNLDQLPDGKRGCAIHHTITSPGEITQSSFCQNFDCLPSDFPELKRQRAKEVANSLPPGEFKLSQVLSKLS